MTTGAIDVDYTPETTALAKREVPFDPYAGIASSPFPPEVQAILARPPTDDEISVLPDSGELFLQGVLYRQRLIEAFGAGGWALRPMSTIVDRDQKTKSGEPKTVIYYTGHLIVLGRFVSEATGEGEWIHSNAKNNYGTALEGAKTNCLSRCAKDIGVAACLWDKRFSEPWKLAHCVNQGGAWRKRPPQPIKVEPNVPKPRAGVSGGVGAIPKNKEYLEDKGKELREQYAGTMGVGHIAADPEPDIKNRKSDRAPTAKDLERALDKVLPEVELARNIGGERLEVTDRQTGEKSIEDQRTTEQNAKIHALRAELGYDKGEGEKDYRHALWLYFRVRSSALLTVAQASNLIDRLEKSKRNLGEGP